MIGGAPGFNHLLPVGSVRQFGQGVEKMEIEWDDYVTATFFQRLLYYGAIFFDGSPGRPRLYARIEYLSVIMSPQGERRTLRLHFVTLPQMTADEVTAQVFSTTCWPWNLYEKKVGMMQESMIYHALVYIC